MVTGCLCLDLVVLLCILHMSARSAKHVLAIVILFVRLSRPGTNQAQVRETPGFHRMIAESFWFLETKFCVSGCCNCPRMYRRENGCADFLLVITSSMSLRAVPRY